MITIRDSQMAEFDRDGERRFILRVIDHMRHKHPDVVDQTQDTELRLRVETAIKQGRSLGLTLEGSLTAFTALTFILVPDFFQCERIQRFLNDETRAPDLRIERLLHEATVQDWVAAMKH